VARSPVYGMRGISAHQSSHLMMNTFFPVKTNLESKHRRLGERAELSDGCGVGNVSPRVSLISITHRHIFISVPCLQLPFIGEEGSHSTPKLASQVSHSSNQSL
jgi:hypothetical protein